MLFVAVLHALGARRRLGSRSLIQLLSDVVVISPLPERQVTYRVFYGLSECGV